VTGGGKSNATGNFGSGLFGQFFSADLAPSTGTPHSRNRADGTSCRQEGDHVSIAQVLNVSGGPGIGATPPPETEKMTVATKALDGCEHIYVMGNSGGEGLAVIVWRDEMAMKAAANHIAADNEALKDMLNMSVTPGPVYENFMEM
jgi:hypothetical protein